MLIWIKFENIRENCTAGIFYLALCHAIGTESIFKYSHWYPRSHQPDVLWILLMITNYYFFIIYGSHFKCSVFKFMYQSTALPLTLGSFSTLQELIIFILSLLNLIGWQNSIAERLSTAEICTLMPNELADTMEYIKILNKDTQKIYKLQPSVPAEHCNVQL